MGDPAPRKKPDYTTRRLGDHPITDAAGRSAMNAVELRFDALREGERRDGAYPLHMAIASGASKTIIEALIREAEDVSQMTNKFGELPLHVAVNNRSKEVDVVDVVLAAYFGAACLQESRDGNIPLHIAVMHGCSHATAKRLLETFPMAALQKNFNQKVPIDLAIECGSCSDDVIELLRQKQNYEKSKKTLFET